MSKTSQHSIHPLLPLWTEASANTIGCSFSTGSNSSTTAMSSRIQHNPAPASYKSMPVPSPRTVSLLHSQISLHQLLCQSILDFCVVSKLGPCINSLLLLFCNEIVNG
ncbi:hypothetical protein C5167_023029 [Papaver somniferum]|uniref:Uncharacterized protein n=1 Tax=Papaver somniferum TaxID=3469 RepID=A0A4Y7JJI4_PAPSO|nr:hypothetical protein C5167_023029 [Papaver somniferum]